MTLARLLVILSLDSGAFRAGMLTAMNQIGILQSRLGGMGAGQALSSAGRALTYGLTIPLIAAAAAIGNVGSSLDAEMARVQSVIATPMDSGLAQVLEWRDGVQQLGIDMGRSSTEVAGGLYEIVSAIPNATNQMEYLQIAARAAVAGQSDIVTSTKNLVLATRAWGDSSTDQVQKMANLMSATVRVGTVTESELGPAMAGLLPVMRLYGVGLKEGFAGIASLAGVSGTASMAATQLQRAILSLVAPNTALQKAMKDTNTESFALTLQTENGLIKAFQRVKEISEETGVPLNKLLGRVEGLKAIATLTGPQLEAFGDNMAALEDSAWAVDQAFAGTTEGINKTSFQWSQAGQRMRVIGEDLYQSFGPAALKVLDALQPVIDKLKDLSDTIAGMETEKVTQIVYGLLGLAALGPAVSVLGSVVRMFTFLRSGVMLAGAAFGLLGPYLAPALSLLLRFLPVIGWIMAAVTLLAVAWNSNFLGIQDRTAAFVARWQQSTGAISEAWGRVKAAFASFDLSKSIGGWLSSVGTALSEFGGTVIGVFIESVMAAFGTSTAQLFASMGAAWNSGIASLKGMVSAAWAGIVSIWNNGVNTIKAQASQLWNGIGQGAKNAFMLALTTVSSFGTAVVSALMAAVTGVMAFGSAMRSAFTSAINSAIASVRTFGSSISSAFTSAITAARNAASSIVSAFARNWSSIGSNIASGIAGGIRAGIGAITSAAASAANAALSAAKSALGIKSPSSVMDRQVGYMIPAGVAGGIYRGLGLITRAMGSIYSAAKMDAYNLSANVAGSMQMQNAPVLAGGAGGGFVINIENNFAGSVDDATIQQVEQANSSSITKALRSRGLI